MSADAIAPDAPSSEALRAHMQGALGVHADPRLPDMIRTAEIIVVPMTSTWEGSAGQVRAHRVGLGLGATELGNVSGAPHLVDALVRAAARAIAELEPAGVRWALGDLRLYWRGSAHAANVGYRDVPPPTAPLANAIAEFLSARGDTEATAWASSLVVDERGPGEPVMVRGAARHHRPGIEACLRVLLAGFDERRVRIVWG